MFNPSDLSAYFQDAFAYDQWANRLVWDALDHHQIVDERCHAWMSHIVNAHLIWQARWEGRADGPAVGVLRPAAENIALLQAFYPQVQSLLSNASPALLDQCVFYRNLRGDEYSQPLREILAHVLNHATHHRGQCVARIRELGFAPPATDLIVYFRSR